MTKLSTGLKHLTAAGMKRICPISGRRQSTNGTSASIAKTSFRQARIGCKKLQRKLRRAKCDIFERNRAMAEEQYLNGNDAARDRAAAEENDSLMMVITLLLMQMAEKRQEQAEYAYETPSQAHRPMTAPQLTP